MASKPNHDAESEAIIVIHGDHQEDEYMLYPRGFNIIWGNDNRYWRIPPLSSPSQNINSVAQTAPAELIQVSWLEVTSSVTLKPLTSYQITFELSFKGDAFGWNGAPVYLMAKVGKNGRDTWTKLEESENLPKTPTEVPSKDRPFVIESPDQPDTRLYFGLYEIWSGRLKGGLKFHGANVKRIDN